jgi:hypothetical protein
MISAAPFHSLLELSPFSSFFVLVWKISRLPEKAAVQGGFIDGCGSW